MSKTRHQHGRQQNKTQYETKPNTCTVQSKQQQNHYTVSTHQIAHGFKKVDDLCDQCYRWMQINNCFWLPLPLESADMDYGMYVSVG